MKTKIYDYDDVLQKNDNSYVKQIRVNDCRDKLDDYHKNGYPLGETSGIKTLDENFRWRYGFLYCFSGYPQSGKSEILNWLMVLRAKLNDDRICMYSPEIDVHEQITNLARAYIGKNVDIAFPNKCTDQEWEDALDFLDEHFIFLENGSEMPSITKLIDAFEVLQKEGFTAFTIDPLNWVYEGTQNDNIYSYLKLSLTSLKQFAKIHQVFMIYVEHPKTPAPVRGKIPKATAYSLAGGTMHFNKCDVMVVMHKLTDEDVEELVKSGQILQKILDNKENSIKFVQFESVKIKSQRINGTTGKVILQYNLITSRYK
tara:strand:- start:5896 stop:6837 length:942 start_codon:yes stop_codon:yes gene_type:complete